MFNFKKIGITLGILGVVGLTGALMVGPAFASPKDKGGLGGTDHGSNKDNICHYNALVMDDTTTEVDESEAEAWMDKTVDSSSSYKHVGKHSPEGSDDSDFYILFGTEIEANAAGEFDMNDSTEDCTRLQLPFEPAP